MMSELETDRTTLRRHPERGRHGREDIYAVLDAGWVCHVGIATERGPVVIPTAYGRVDDRLFLHGSPASRLVRSMTRGVPVCVTVTHLDGLVLARSAFHHSLNFRSVVVFGTAHPVTDPSDKRAALDAFVDHVLAGRSAEVRPPTDKELRGTSVLEVPIEEASAKVRTGPPIDDEEDLGLPVWAGEVPLRLAAGPLVPAPGLGPDRDPPASVRSFLATSLAGRGGWA